MAGLCALEPWSRRLDIKDCTSGRIRPADLLQVSEGAAGGQITGTKSGIMWAASAIRLVVLLLELRATMNHLHLAYIMWLVGALGVVLQ